MKAILSLLYSIMLAGAWAQPVLDPAPYTRIGTYDSAWGSFFVNPARLATSKTRTAALYTEQRFLLAELSFCHLAAAIQVPPGSFGVSGGWQGNKDYSLAKLGLAYARSLGSRVQLGVQFNYARQQTAGYGPAGTAYFEIGTLIRITGPLRMGIHVVQPFAKDPMGAPSAYCLGFGFQPSPAVLVMAELTRKEALPLSLHAAIRYRFEQRLQASIGIDTATGTYYIGGGVAMGWLGLHAIGSFHPALGLSPALMISFQP